MALYYICYRCIEYMYDTQMKFIHVDVINEQLLYRSDLRESPCISSLMRIISLEEIVRGSVTDALPVLLAYGILKHDDPLSPWKIQVYNNIVYLYLVPTDITIRANMSFVLDHAIDEPTIISTMIEDDVINGTFPVASVGEHRQLCMGSDIIDVYDHYTINGVSLPTTKGGLMKMLRHDRIIDDSNAGDMSILIDRMISDIDAYVHADTQGILLAVLKIKIVDTINKLLIAYPPCM